MIDYVPWCVVCQSPHSPNYFVLAQSFSANQNVKNEEEEEKKIMKM